jgi:hypothetical protein
MEKKASHNRGFAGEQAMGFFLGEKGYYFIEGPSGASGHRLTSRGFDGVAFNPLKSHLIIYDNKSFARTGNISSATAVDPARNLQQNLGNLIQRVNGMPHIPDQKQILDLLHRAQTALRAGKPWPVNVQIAISNAGGQSTGISQSLSLRGVQFLNFNSTLRTPSPFSRRCANVAGLIGSLLGSLAQSIGDIAIHRKIRNRLDELQQPINSILMRGDGVLIIIRLQEWEMADYQGRRARNLLGVYIKGGATQAAAKQAFSNSLLEAPARGWRVVTEYMWIEPIM